MANHNDFYIGIDLGTTNSVIAWGQLDPVENLVEPEIIPISMLNIDETIEEKELLPSCVYFREGDAPIVGEYAKAKIGQAEIERTAKSFKIEMGNRDWKEEINGKTYNATDLSSMVLRTLKEGAEEQFFKNIPFPDNVAIAVPASFEDEMKVETLEAAHRAGFKAPVLVDEPIAVLHSFHNVACMGGVPEFRFDLGTSKLVLVFDFGGGTLDVSLHEVSYGRDIYDLQIDSKKKEISRFTKIGGDNFDRELANFLLGKYQGGESDQPCNSPERKGLVAKFQLYAEIAKIELCSRSEIWQIHNQNVELDPNSIKARINEVPFGGKPFTYELSLSEYGECVESFLARDLTLDSVDQYNPSSEADNIIDPILYVLKEAQKRRGYIPKPDIVLLNGSMAKLHTIQKRLEEFFGFSPVEFGESESAIARGAVAWLVDTIRNA